MNSRTNKNLSWSDILAGLRKCTGTSVVIRDGKSTEPAGSVRNRPAAKGTELCVFPGETAATTAELIERLQMLARTSAQRFRGSARASINGAHLVIDSVADDTIDDVLVAVLNTRRPTLGYNQSQQVGDSTTLRSKRIKTG